MNSPLKMKTIIDCAGNPMGSGESRDAAIVNTAQNLGIPVETVEDRIDRTDVYGYIGDEETLILVETLKKD